MRRNLNINVLQGACEVKSSFYPCNWFVNFGCQQQLSRFLSISVLRKAFESFDSQKTGSISTETVAEILRLMGQPFNRETLEEMITEVDEDKSGRLEFEEFIILAAKFIVEDDEEARKWLMCLLDFPADAPANTTFCFIKLSVQKELKEAFRLYDKEGNGFIPTSCLKEILRELDDQLSNADLDGMIQEIDSDGSGTVDFDGKRDNASRFSKDLLQLRGSKGWLVGAGWWWYESRTLLTSMMIDCEKNKRCWSFVFSVKDGFKFVWVVQLF